jgi:hypothetical protein
MCLRRAFMPQFCADLAARVFMMPYSASSEAGGLGDYSACMLHSFMLHLLLVCVLVFVPRCLWHKANAQ